VKRVLKKEGTAWLNLGDSYASGKSRYSTVPQTLEGKEKKDEKYGSLQYGKKIDFKHHPVIKDKDLIGIPFMVAFALRADGWWLRQDIIWNKKNPMPESVTDRCTRSHEYIFLLSKSANYYFDYEAIQEEANYDGRTKIDRTANRIYDEKNFPLGLQSMQKKDPQRWKFRAKNTFDIKIENKDGEMIAIRNKRDVWTVATKPYNEAHFATFPEKLIKDCILAGCPENGIVLDPFMGAGTTALVARKLNRNYTGIELNPEYIKLANKRLYDKLGMWL
jgi:DNA modification methylase